MLIVHLKSHDKDVLKRVVKKNCRIAASQPPASRHPAASLQTESCQPAASKPQGSQQLAASQPQASRQLAARQPPAIQLYLYNFIEM